MVTLDKFSRFLLSYLKGLSFWLLSEIVYFVNFLITIRVKRLLLKPIVLIEVSLGIRLNSPMNIWLLLLELMSRSLIGSINRTSLTAWPLQRTSLTTRSTRMVVLLAATKAIQNPIQSLNWLEQLSMSLLELDYSHKERFIVSFDLSCGWLELREIPWVGFLPHIIAKGGLRDLWDKNARVFVSLVHVDFLQVLEFKVDNVPGVDEIVLWVQASLESDAETAHAQVGCIAMLELVGRVDGHVDPVHDGLEEGVVAVVHLLLVQDVDGILWIVSEIGVNEVIVVVCHCDWLVRDLFVLF